MIPIVFRNQTDFIYHVPQKGTVTLQTIYYPTKQTYESYARSTIDTLIVTIAMENRSRLFIIKTILIFQYYIKNNYP